MLTYCCVGRELTVHLLILPRGDDQWTLAALPHLSSIRPINKTCHCILVTNVVAMYCSLNMSSVTKAIGAGEERMPGNLRLQNVLPPSRCEPDVSSAGPLFSESGDRFDRHCIHIDRRRALMACTARRSSPKMLQRLAVLLSVVGEVHHSPLAVIISGLAFDDGFPS